MSAELEMMKAMASLFRKKAAVMEALGGGMEKKGENEHFNYKFVTASDIKRTVSNLFIAHGLSLQMSGVHTENVVSVVEVKDYQTKGVRPKEVPILRIQFAINLCDVDTGAVEQSFWFGEAGATDDKAASKAATSALKYFLISNLMIADKEEDARDTDAGKKRRKQEVSDNPPPPPSSAVHWSLNPDVLSRMYAKMLKENNATEQDVNAAIRATGWPLVQMSGDQVTEAVKMYMSKKG